MTTAAAERGPRRWAPGALLTVALAADGLLAYAPALTAWFVGDDLEEIKSAHLGGSLRSEQLHPGRNLRPVTLWTLDVTHGLAGLHPTAYHLGNLALHVATALLVALLTATLLGDPDRRRMFRVAAVAGALFVVLPNHIEAVTAISARGDVLATGLQLLALLVWVRRPTAAGRLAALACFAVALGSKEIAVTFPLTLALVLAGRAQPGPGPGAWRARARAAAASWPAWVGLVAYLAVRRIVLGTVKSGSIVDEFVGDSVPRLAVRWAALVVRTVLPGMGPIWWAVVAAAGCGSAVALLWARRRGRGPWAAPAPGRDPSVDAAFASVAWSLVAAAVLCLAPVAHLGVAASDTAGERLVYLSTALVVPVAAWLVDRSLTGRAATALVAALVVVCLAASVAVNLRWRESGALARRQTMALAALPRDRPAYLFGAADSLRGAFAMRNAVNPALVLVHGWDDPPRIDELATVRVASAASGRDAASVRVTRVGPRSWRFELVSPRLALAGVAGTPGSWEVRGVTVRRLDGGAGIVATFPADVDPSQIWYYRDGELVPVGG